MTALAPAPLLVSMVQAATILPVFLLALPAGALADTIDRRHFLLGAQVWTMLCAALLAGLTITHQTTAASLLVLTFAIGVGAAMTGPAWSAIVSELVPREDLVSAIALNGIGFNIAGALGPALAGVLLLVFGSGATFALFAVSIITIIAALAAWHPRTQPNTLPPEHLIGAMRTGLRYVRNTPAMRAAVVRIFACSLSAAAPWALLPLVVRRQLGLDAGSFGLILGLMGVGGVTAGLGLPWLHKHFDRGGIIVRSGCVSAVGIAGLGLADTWWQAAAAMALFGTGWVASFSTVQAAAQLAAPPWVRARALAIYQLSFNLALTLGSFGWGGLAGQAGLRPTLLIACATLLLSTLAARPFRLDPAGARPTAHATAAADPQATDPQATDPQATDRQATLSQPEPPDLSLASLLPDTRARVLETVDYTVRPGQQAAFLDAMAEIRHVRGRAGGLDWRLYQDIAHAEHWLEQWQVERWADHLREAARLTDEDRSALLRATEFAIDGRSCHGARLPRR